MPLLRCSEWLLGSSQVNRLEKHTVTQNLTCVVVTEQQESRHLPLQKESIWIFRFHESGRIILCVQSEPGDRLVSLRLHVSLLLLRPQEDDHGVAQSQQLLYRAGSELAQSHVWLALARVFCSWRHQRIQIVKENENAACRRSLRCEPLGVCAFLAHSVENLSVKVDVRLFCLSFRQNLMNVTVPAAGQQTGDVSVTPEQSHISSRLTGPVCCGCVTPVTGKDDDVLLCDQIIWIHTVWLRFDVCVSPFRQ